MKKIYFILIINLFYYHQVKSQKINVPALIYSYPSSGNHFVRFIIEYLSGKPTVGCVNNQKKDTIIALRPFKDKTLLAHVDITSDPIAYKEHFKYDLEHNFCCIDTLIIIVRSFKESVFARTGGLHPQDLEKYMDIIAYYNQFKGKKLCIYYEDLIMDPRTVTQQLYAFFGLKNSYYYDLFLKNLDEIIKKSLEIDFNNPENLCISAYHNYSHNNLVYHQNALSFEDKYKAELYIKNRWGNTELYDYIKRYVD